MLLQMLAQKGFRMRSIIISIVVNSLLSWTVLPFLIPPFQIYSLNQLGEVLFWQVLGIFTWPIAILGGCFSLIFQAKLSDLGALAIMLIYPGMLLLFIQTLRTKQSKSWKFVLLHILISFSFAAVWYQVLNGYDFMTG
jgi:undecaprenyl pyrophosphate phosphatase UppP